MKKEEREVSLLEQFVPQGTFEYIAPFFKTHTIHLSLTHERKSVLGDYRTPTKEIPHHRISINANLNSYSFLITLLHEISHMLTFIQHGNRILPHGNEWKMQFKNVLLPFIGKQFFPTDVERAIKSYLQNPAASTCSDAQLYKTLRRYDEKKVGYKTVDELPINACFEIEDGQMFRKIEKRRTRTLCKNIKTSKMYLFQGIFEVKEIVS